MHERAITVERDGQHFVESSVEPGKVLEGPFNTPEEALHRSQARSKEYDLRQKIQAKLSEREGPTPGSFRAAQEEGKPATWKETLTPIPEKTAELGRMALGGGREMLGQALTPAETVRDPQTKESIPIDRGEPHPAVQAVRDWLVKGGREQARIANERIQELTPKNQTFWQEAVSSAGTSLGMQAPMYILGVFSRRPGLIVASGFGVQELGRAYAEAKQENPNIPEDQAVRHAFLSGMLETGTELGPAKAIFAPGSKGFKRMVNFMAMELPGENVAEIGQLFSEYINGLRDEEITAQEVIDTMKLTSAATILAGGAQVAVANVIHDAKRRLAQQPEPTPLNVPKSQGAHLRYVSAEGDRYNVRPGEQAPPQMRGEQPMYERGRPVPEEVPMQQVIEGEQRVRELDEQAQEQEADLRRQIHAAQVPQDDELTPAEQLAVEEDKAYWEEREHREPKESKDIGPRPFLTADDMEGMAPEQRKLIEKDDVGVEYFDTPDGIYAMYKGREIGFALPLSEDPSQGFDVSVAREWGRKGIGGNLMRHFLKKNPNYPTGGLTQAGRGMAQKAGLEPKENRLISDAKRGRSAVFGTELGDLIEDLNAYGPDVEPMQHKRAFNALRKRLRAALELGDGTIEKGELGEGHDQIWMRLTPEQQAKGISSRGFVDSEHGFLRGEDELILDSTDLLTEEEQRAWLRDYHRMRGVSAKQDEPKESRDAITGRRKKPQAVERAMDRMAKGRVRTGVEDIDAAIAEVIHGKDKLKIQRAKNMLRKRLRPAVQYVHPEKGKQEHVAEEGEGHLNIPDPEAQPGTVVWGYKDLQTGEFHDVADVGGLDATDLMNEPEIKAYLRKVSGGKLNIVPIDRAPVEALAQLLPRMSDVKDRAETAAADLERHIRTKGQPVVKVLIDKNTNRAMITENGQVVQMAHELGRATWPVEVSEGQVTEDEGYPMDVRSFLKQTQSQGKQKNLFERPKVQRKPAARSKRNKVITPAVRAQQKRQINYMNDLRKRRKDLGYPVGPRYTDGYQSAVKKWGQDYVDAMHLAGEELGHTVVWFEQHRTIRRHPFAPREKMAMIGSGGVVHSSSPHGGGGGGARTAISLNPHVGFEFPHVILGHEVVHQIRSNEPELYEEFAKMAQPEWKYIMEKSHHNFYLLPPGGPHGGYGKTSKGFATLKEEVLADFLGNNLFTKEFLARVAAHKNRSLAARMLNSLRKFLSKTYDVLSRHDIVDRHMDKQFKNSEEMLDKAAEMVAKYHKAREVVKTALKQGKYTLDRTPGPESYENAGKEWEEAFKQVFGITPMEAAVARGMGHPLTGSMAEWLTDIPSNDTLERRLTEGPTMKSNEIKLRPTGKPGEFSSTAKTPGQMPTSEKGKRELAWEIEAAAAFDEGNPEALNDRLASMVKKVWKRKLFNVDANAKTIKGVKYGYKTGVLYLAPADLSGREVCGGRSRGCTASCLNTAGKGAMALIQQRRINRTKRLWQDRERFMSDLHKEIGQVVRMAEEEGLVPVIRLNGTSDLPWEKFKINGKTLMEHYPNVQFYDYTKIKARALKWANGKMPKNYHITFSLAEDNEEAALEVLKRGGIVAAVFRHGLPAKWKGFEVTNADANDLRFKDKPGTIAGLIAKGMGTRDDTGFVKDVPQNEIVVTRGDNRRAAKEAKEMNLSLRTEKKGPGEYEVIEFDPDSGHVGSHRVVKAKTAAEAKLKFKASTKAMDRLQDDTPKEQGAAHLTAISRKQPSSPMRYLESEGLLRGKMLDYGSGRGYDAEHYGMDAYDPHYQPKAPTGKYDTITSNFVLNVLNPKEADKVITKVRMLLKPGGTAYFTVRRDIKKEGETSKGTYQRTVKLGKGFELIQEKKGGYAIYRMTK